MKSNYFLQITHPSILSFFLFFSVVTLSQRVEGGGGCTDPVISQTTGPGTICEGESANLTATHDGDGVNWYDAPAGGNLLGTGSPFETGPLTSTTSFWAEAFTEGTGAPIPGCARVAPTNTSASEVIPVSSPWGLAFNADVDLTINTVDVYLADPNPGTVVMQLKDSGLNILEEESISVPAGNSSTPVQHSITLNWFVPTGADYNLVASSSPVMVREFSSGHPGFPYPIGGVGTVTNGTINDNDTNANVYYFFYNWTVTPGQTCYSDRVEEVVTVNPTPDAPTGDANQEFNSGETLADLDVNGTNLTWYSDPAATVEIPDTTPMIDGTTYYVTQTIDECEGPVLAITVTELLGFSDSSFSNFKFAPNPTSDKLSIQNATPIEKLEVYSILGQQVLKQLAGETQILLNVSTLSNGIYLLKAYSHGQVNTKKFSKQ